MLRLLARLLAYVGTLGLVAVARRPSVAPNAGRRIGRAPAKSGWSIASRSIRRSPSVNSVFPTNQRLTRFFGTLKAAARTSSAGGPDGKRGERPVAELEVYRPVRIQPDGGRHPPRSPARMKPRRGRELRGRRGVDRNSHLMLLRPAGHADDARSCLGSSTPRRARLQISGWSCQGDTIPAGPPPSAVS